MRRRVLMFLLLCVLPACSEKRERTGVNPRRESPNLQEPLKQNPPLTGKPEELHVTVVSDIHPGQSRRSPILAESLFAVRPQDTWGTFFLGDVTNVASSSDWDLFSSYFQKTLTQRNFRIVAGNHDYPASSFGQCCSGGILAEKLPEYRHYFAEKIRNTYIVFLDTGRLTQDLGAAQWSFLESELTKAAALEARHEVDWTVVAMHQVLVTAGDKREDTNMVNMRSRFANLFKKYGVDVVMGGHQHVAQATALDGILFLGTPSGGGVFRADYRPSLKGFNPSNDFSTKEFIPELFYSTLGFLDLEFKRDALQYHLRNSDGVELYRFQFDVKTRQILPPETVKIHVCLKDEVNANLLFSKDISLPMHRDEALGTCWYTQKVMRPQGEFAFAIDNTPTVEMSATRPPYRTRRFATAAPEVFIYNNTLRTSGYFSWAEQDGTLDKTEILYGNLEALGRPTLRLLKNDATGIVLQTWCDQKASQVEITRTHLVVEDDKYVTYALPLPECSNLVFTTRVSDGDVEVQPLWPNQGRFVHRGADFSRLVEVVPGLGSENISPAVLPTLRFSRFDNASWSDRLSILDNQGRPVTGKWETTREADGGKSALLVFHPEKRLSADMVYTLKGLPADIFATPISFRTRATPSLLTPTRDGKITSSDNYAFHFDDAADNPWGRHGDFDSMHVTWQAEGLSVGVDATLFKNDLTLLLVDAQPGLPACAEMGSLLSRPHRLSTLTSPFLLFITLDENGKVRVGRPGSAGACPTAQEVPAADLGILATASPDAMGRLELFIPWSQLPVRPFGLKGVVTTARGDRSYGDLIPNNSVATPDALDNFWIFNPDEDGNGLPDLL